MGIQGIQEIIYNSKIIKIKNNIYFCIYKNWTVKIQLSEDEQEYCLHYNGVYLTSEHTFEKDFKILGSTLKEHLKKENSCNL